MEDYLNLDSFFLSEKVLPVVNRMGGFFSKFHHLPKKIISFLAAIVPWLTLFGGLVWLIASLATLALSMLSLLTLNFVVIASLVVSFLYAAASSYLMIRPFKLLRQRDLRGWIYLWWLTVLSSADSLWSLFGDGNLLAIILSILVSFYLLFEIKSAYEAASEN
jgi:hypothetical protein